MIQSKKQILLTIIKEIEKVTGVQYPDLYIYYPMIIDTKSSSITRAVIDLFPLPNDPSKCEHRVYVSGFTLILFEREILMGIMIEEFLHYAYRTKCALNGIKIGGQPDKEMIEPIGEWFTGSYYSTCFQSAQVKANSKEWEKAKKDWIDKGYPIHDFSRITNMSKRQKEEILISSPSDIVEALARRGKVRHKAG